MSRASCLLAILGAALAACGDNTAHAVDAPASADGCSASFDGNFAESSTAPENCPVLSGSALTFTVPVRTLATSLAVAIDLGATPSAGTYSSQTAMTWQATATQTIGGRYCFYTAGSATVPHGSFALTLSMIDGAGPHGTLAVLQYVLAGLNAKCGAGDTESVMLAF